jgi:hypothetical protein
MDKLLPARQKLLSEIELPIIKLSSIDRPKCVFVKP